MYNTLKDIGIAAIQRIPALWKSGTSDTLIDYTSVSRVEPIVLIDSDLVFYESLHDLQQSLLSMFAGYYLQAVALTTTVGKIEVAKVLDHLNPNRKPLDAAVNSMGLLLAKESYYDGLPIYNKSNALEADNHQSQMNQKDTHYYDTYEQKERQFNDSRDQQDRHFDDQSRRAWLEYNQKVNQFASAEEKNRYERDMAERMFGQKTDEAIEKVRQFNTTFEANKKKMSDDKAFQQAKFELEKDGFKLRQQERNDRLTSSEIGYGKDTMKTLTELSNLSVGKLFTVEITDGLHKASIPVSIRLIATSIPTNNLQHMLTMDSKDTSMKERYYAWKADRIDFIKDLCLCQDLIDIHRKNLMMDQDNLYATILKRARGNMLSTIVSGNPSVATASNMIIMSANTADGIERTLNIKFSSFKSREEVFKKTYVMIIVVVDVQFDQITMYHRGINMPTHISARSLKGANKNGPDVADILSAYRLGNSPRL